LYWTPKKDGHLTNKRVIIPFTYDNKIVGYTGRLCIEPPNKSISKYINKFPVDYIYNIDANRSHLRNTILITEGVIDAYLMDGISTCGNTISQAQIDYINSLKKRVIVCPDFDKDGYVLVEVAVKNGWEVSIPNWKREIKDAAQASLVYGRILTLESILSSTESSLIAINLKWKARVK
jgi:DNA primase